MILTQEYDGHGQRAAAPNVSSKLDGRAVGGSSPLVTHAAASSSSGTLVPAAGAELAATGLVGTTPDQAPPPLPPPPLSPTLLPAIANSVVTGSGDPSPNMAALQLTGPVAVRQAFGSKAFVVWLKELSPEQLAEVTESIDAFAAAHSEWLRAHADHAKAVDVLQGTKKRSAFKVNFKRAMGLRYLSWRAGSGKDSRSQHKDFLLSIREYPDRRPPKKDRVWLRGCQALAEDEELQLDSLARRCHEGKRQPNAKSGTPDRFLLRRRGRQGAPFKCPVVRELLFDWFVDMRSSIASNLTPRFVLMKARELAGHALKHMRETGDFSELPVFGRMWLLRWKRDYGVVFRRSNVRFKRSKGVLIERLRAMWLNVIRVRRLIWHFTGHDVGSRMYGIDEKPIHFNEGGSKLVRTLEIAGAPSVKLKENHAATRERASVMTCVTSDPAAARQQRLLPVSVVFYGNARDTVES